MAEKRRRVLTGDKLTNVMEPPSEAEELEVKPLYAPRPQTVLCPLHKTPLAAQVEGDKKFAVCNCDIPGNKHKGQVVWQRNSS
jgi:hypothetical protein